MERTSHHAGARSLSGIATIRATGPRSSVTRSGVSTSARTVLPYDVRSKTPGTNRSGASGRTTRSRAWSRSRGSGLFHSRPVLRSLASSTSGSIHPPACVGKASSGFAIERAARRATSTPRSERNPTRVAGTCSSRPTTAVDPRLNNVGHDPAAGAAEDRVLREPRACRSSPAVCRSKPRGRWLAEPRDAVEEALGVVARPLVLRAATPKKPRSFPRRGTRRVRGGSAPTISARGWNRAFGERPSVIGRDGSLGVALANAPGRGRACLPAVCPRSSRLLDERRRLNSDERCDALAQRGGDGVDQPEQRCARRVGCLVLEQGERPFLDVSPLVTECLCNGIEHNGKGARLAHSRLGKQRKRL